MNPEKLWATLESSHLFSVMVSIPDNNNKMVASNIDYALIGLSRQLRFFRALQLDCFPGHVMNTIPIRDPASKWYLPPTFYPLNIFPSFLSGTGYVFTGSLVPALYYCALRTPFINLEDVFLTGLCASTQLRLKLTHNNVQCYSASSAVALRMLKF